MKFYSRKRRTPVINIIPMIDILVILLIFFIVTSTFKKKHPQLEINLPNSKTAQAAAASDNEPIVLRVKNATEITLDEKPVTLSTLAESLRTARAQSPGRSVAMQADREAPFGVVVKVLDALKQAGIENIPAFTQPEDSAAPRP